MEHNVLEGLPINQYREVEITIEPSTAESKHIDKDAWPEPPMPRDFQLLPEHSQQILRAARAGRTYKPPTPLEEEKELGDEEDEQKEVPRGFTVKKWTKVPRHLEEAEPEYLAKRRKGLPSQYALSGQVATQPVPMRETKVKKTDADGNVNIYKVLVPEGQAVEGEIQPTDTTIDAAPVAAAPGTVVEGVGVVNAEGVVVANDVMQQTPPRRRPPPPKKKKKSGPGRGKKKVLFVEGAAEEGTPASATGSDLLAVPGTKQEEGSVEPSEGGDTPMPDAGDDEEGSGDEGSDDDEHEEGTHPPTPAQAPSAPETPAEAIGGLAPEAVQESGGEVAPPPETVLDTEPPIAAAEEPGEPMAIVEDTTATIALQPEVVKEEAPHRDPSSSPDMPLSAIAHSRQNSLNQIPTIATLDASAIELVAEPSVVEVSHPVAEPAAVELHQSAVEPITEMVEPLADIIPVPAPEAVSEAAPEPLPEPLPELVPEAVPEPAIAPEPASESISAVPELPAAEEVQASDGEPDLLGSLERQLEKDSESMAGP